MDDVDFTPCLTPGERLREERERMGLSIAQMASIADVGNRVLTEWEKVERSDTMQAFVAWHRAGMDILYVITGQRTPETLAGATIRQALDALPEPKRRRILLALLEYQFSRSNGPVAKGGMNLIDGPPAEGDEKGGG